MAENAGWTNPGPNELGVEAFARLAGITRQTARLWRDRGYLAVTKSGKIDAKASSDRLLDLKKITHDLITGEQVNAPEEVKWSGRSAKRTQDQVKSASERAPDPEPPAEQPAPDPEPEQPQPTSPAELDDPYMDELNRRLDRGEMLKTLEASQVKENYLARQRRLQYEREEGNVVEVEAATSILQEAMARVRQRLLAMPTKVAPRLVNQPKAPPIEDMIREEVNEVLEELSRMDVDDLLQTRSE